MKGLKTVSISILILLPLINNNVYAMGFNLRMWEWLKIPMAIMLIIAICVLGVVLTYYIYRKFQWKILWLLTPVFGTLILIVLTVLTVILHEVTYT